MTGITESGNATAGWTYTLDTTTGGPAVSISSFGNAASSNTVVVRLANLVAGAASPKITIASDATATSSDRLNLWVDSAGVLNWSHGNGATYFGTVPGVPATTTLHLASALTSGWPALVWSLDGIRWRSTSVVDNSKLSTSRFLLADAPAGKGDVTARLAIRK